MDIPKHDPSSADEKQLVQTNLPAETQQILLSLGLEIARSGHVVWRKDNPSHPRNWTGTRKTFDIGLVVVFDFFACVSQCVDIG